MYSLSAATMEKKITIELIDSQENKDLKRQFTRKYGGENNDQTIENKRQIMHNAAFM